MLEIDPQEAVAYGLFSRRQARAAGFSEKDIARRLRTGTWAPLDHGIYRDATRAERVEDRLVHAALRAGRNATASHLTAAHVLGWSLLKDPAPLQFTVPRSNGWIELRDVKSFRRDLHKTEMSVVGVIRVTVPARTAIDLAADVPLLDAVVAIDSGLRLRHLSMSDLRRAARDRRTIPQRERVMHAVDLVDPSSGSVPESVARVLFRVEGLTAPKTQYVVDDEEGRFVARVDFAWPEFWLVVEIDGFEWHGGKDAFQSDRDRQNEIELAGWTVLRFTADDVRDNPEKVTAAVRRALSKRGC